MLWSVKCLLSSNNLHSLSKTNAYGKNSKNIILHFNRLRFLAPLLCSKKIPEKQVSGIFRLRWVSVFHGTHRQSRYNSQVSNPEQLKKIMRLRFGILAVICNRYANWKVCLLLAYNRQVRYVLWNIGKQYPWVSWKSFHQVNRGSDKHITKNARDKTEILLRHSNAIKQWKPTT